jgi:HK97 family phage prohead protease
MRMVAFGTAPSRPFQPDSLLPGNTEPPQPRARAEEQDTAVMERSSMAVAHVTTAERTIEIVAVPYDTEARVYWRDEWWVESFAPGSFAEFIRSGVLPRVNREHTKGDTVGKIVALRETPQGLVATIRIAQTPRGEETLLLAAEDMISASIGFTFGDGPGGRIVNRASRTIRVLRARLDHLSLVESPAYEDARVLSVRRR